MNNDTTSREAAREILFRGKCVDTGKWLYGGYAIIEPPPVCFADEAEKQASVKHCIVIERGCPEWGMPRQYGMAEADPSTIGQYTGLTDKDGVKIFEDDIVKTYSGLAGCIKFGQFYDGEYGLERYGWCWHGRDEEGVPCNFALDPYWTRPEIIGNVYDNPEYCKMAMDRIASTHTVPEQIGFCDVEARHA